MLLKRGGTSIGDAVLSFTGGEYVLFAPVGTGYTINASKSGYDPGTSAAFAVTEAGVTGKDIALVKATPPPTGLILTDPEDQYVVVGQRATFSVTTSGDNLTCQWYINRRDGRGWLALDGSTGTRHVTTETNLACDGYRYYCQVANASGQERNSLIATLHVRTAPEQPDTGDSAAPALWLAMLLLGGAGLCIMFRRRRRA